MLPEKARLAAYGCGELPESTKLGVIDLFCPRLAAIEDFRDLLFRIAEDLCRFAEGGALAEMIRRTGHGDAVDPPALGHEAEDLVAFIPTEIEIGVGW